MIKKKGIKMFRIIAWLFLNVSVQTISSLGEENNVASTFMQTSTKRETNDRQIQGPYLLGAVERKRGWPIKGEKGPDCTTCVKFNLTPYSNDIKIDQSTLWIYISQPLRNYFRKNIASIQTSLLTQNNTKKSTIQQLVNYNRKGWYVIKLKNFPKHDLLGTNQIVLLIDCIFCEVDLQGVMLIPSINKKNNSEKSLKMRTIFKTYVKRFKPAKPTFKPTPLDVRPKKCTSNTTECCLDDFLVKFKDIDAKLAKQLIWPRGTNIGKCRGSCNNPQETLNAHSSEFSNKVIARSNCNNEEASNKKPCCVPQSYKPITLTVFNETEQKVALRKVDDMVVRECGCIKVLKKRSVL